MEKQSTTTNRKFTISIFFFRNTWSKESTIITLHNLYLQTIGTLWKAQTECYRKLQDRPDRSNEAKMVKRRHACRHHRGHLPPALQPCRSQSGKMSRLAMYDLDHLNERTSAVKALFPCSPLRGLHADQYLRQRPQSRRISRCPHPGRVSSRLRHLPADTGTHRRASVRRTMRPHHPALFLRMGCRRLLQSHSRTLSVEGRTRHRPLR